MNKTFSRILCLLLSTLLCLGGSCLAAAEASAFPICPPPTFGEIPTQFALFSGMPVDYRITLQVDEATGLRTYTIPNPLAWGLAASVPGLWEYAEETGWQRTGDLEGEQVQLILSGDAFEAYGFPLWIVPCSDETVTLSLSIHLGEVRHLYAYVDYQFANGVVSITAEDHSFILNAAQSHEDGEGYNSIYASYDPSGVLAYATYSQASADGSFTAYTMDADVPHQTYRVSDVSYMDPEGNSAYWNCQDGQWQNENFQPVDAPEQVSLETLPFAIVGGWAGIPFEQPGDKPEGVFPASAAVVDPALIATEYKPWPEEAEALYRNWAEAGPIPALPEVSWLTLEDGAALYTLTGCERWGVQEADMVPWVWDDSIHQWMDGHQSTPGQITLTYPADADLSTLFWEQPTADPDELFMLDLSRSSMMITAGFDNVSEGYYWQMDNLGGLVFIRPLDGNRTVEAIYDDYTLIEYNIHQSDENGNRLAQACYEPSDEDPSVFQLGCFFLYSPEMDYQEALWIKDIGWYSYETGAPCDAPEGIDLAQYPPLGLK